MNTFIEDNWFKLVISSAVVAIAIFIGYYFFTYLPQERIGKEELANQIKCQQDGTELYNSQKKEMGSSGSLGNPEFKFNNDLKICLYKNMIVSANFVDYLVVDVYTNKEIASWMQIKSQKTGQWEDLSGSQAEWKAEVKRLFGI